MIKFLKKLFSKDVLFDLSKIDGFVKNYELDLDRFEKDWMTGDGVSDYVKGVNYEWLSPESVSLENEEIHITSIHRPTNVEGEIFDYKTGMVTTTRFFSYGYYEFSVDLPNKSSHTPTVEIFNPESNIELVMGNYGVKKIGLLYSNGKIELYHDNLLVKKIKNGDIGSEVKLRIKHGLNPSVEGTHIKGSDTLRLISLDYYSKK